VLRTLIQFGWFVGGYLALRVLVVAVPVASRRVRSLRARWRASRVPPILRLSLLVSVNEAYGSILPRVQLRGERLRAKGRVRLELVDERGKVRFASSRDLPASAVGTELSLPSFLPPPDARLDDVLRWRWDVAVDVGRRKAARWSERLVLADGLDHEGEIGPGPI
jgi:hypothetical protein